MDLSSFNSYFEILVGINLGYAAIDYFKNVIQDKIFKTNHLTNILVGLQSRLQIHISERDEKDKLYTLLNNVKDEVRVQSLALDGQEKRERGFFEVLRPISLLLAVLCIGFILTASFQDNTDNYTFESYNNFATRLGMFISFFCTIIFFCSLSFRIIENKIIISPLELIFSFLILGCFSCDFVFDSIFVSNVSKVLAIFILPHFLYFLILFRNIIAIPKYKRKKPNELIGNFFNFFIDKISLILIYLILMSMPLLLFLLFLSYDEFHFFQYLIILIAPTLLFIYLIIRVKIHNNVYRKRYIKLSVEHSATLENLLCSVEPIINEEKNGK